MLTFICHSRCTTCRRARDFLDARGIEYVIRDIAAENPSRTELEKWLGMSGRDVKKAFNTSGQQYRALGLKDRLKEMSAEAALELLATDGMLVKRPVLVGDGFALFGFKEAEWISALEEQTPENRT